MIIATSGHVDHGKTALLEALTGTHTAHLPEEKKRGMTIDLGYAYLPLDEQHILGFIDVPGHEKFLGNMLAGLGGIDYAMLVVAANEGIQAQTHEHLNILKLLDFKEIILVISKADLADDKQISELVSQLRQKYPVLLHSPIFITSTKNQRGVVELREYLAALPNLAQQARPFRYAIDRIFHIKGAGTVVTGTAFSGEVNVEQELFFSDGQKVRVKNIHSQNQKSTKGIAGQRLALNIHHDMARELISRGDWLFSQPPVTPTERISVQLQSLVSLKENQAVHIYYAATRTTGRLNLLQDKNLMPEQQALAEIILDKPLFLTYGDSLIVRSGDAKQLIAGARVLEIYSPSRYKRSEQHLNYLTQLQLAKTEAERIQLYLANNALPLSTLAWIEQLTHSQLKNLLAQIEHQWYQDWCFSADYQQQQKNRLLATLAQYHQRHDDQIGISKARLCRIACLRQPEKLMFHFIDELLSEQKLQQTRGWLHLPHHKIQFDENEQQCWRQTLAIFEQQQGQPLWVRDVATALQIEETAMRNFLYKAGKLGYLTPVVKDRFFLTTDIYAYAALIKQYIGQFGAISVNQLRDELGFGRKLTVQLIEYFDRSGFLRRKGNVHILRDAQLFDALS